MFVNRLKNTVGKSLIVASSILSTVTFAANWSLTPTSQVGFNIDSMGMSLVKGTFKQVQSSLSFDPQAVQKALTRFVMESQSLSLSKPSLNTMIMGEDLFYVAKYKTVTFQSSAFKAVGQDKYQILGQLTIRGITKPVIFNAQMKLNPVNQLMDFHASTVIKRSDFGMKKAVGGIGEKVNIQVSGQWKMQ